MKKKSLATLMVLALGGCQTSGQPSPSPTAPPPSSLSSQSDSASAQKWTEKGTVAYVMPMASFSIEYASATPIAYADSTPVYEAKNGKRIYKEPRADVFLERSISRYLYAAGYKPIAQADAGGERPITTIILSMSNILVDLTAKSISFDVECISSNSGGSIKKQARHPLADAFGLDSAGRADFLRMNFDGISREVRAPMLRELTSVLDSCIAGGKNEK